MRKQKYLVSDENFIEAIKNSFSIAEALRKIGMSNFGSAYIFFKKRAQELNIDTSHFIGRGHRQGKTFVSNKRVPLVQILIKDSNKPLRTAYKRRLIEEGLLEEKCIICSLEPVWCKKKLVLQIDHINGDCLDHRIENLRLLCPNCHSQTDTFCFGSSTLLSKTERTCGVIRPRKEKVQYFCNMCGKEIKRSDSKYCGECYRLHRKELQTPFDRAKKIIWPSIEELSSRLSEVSYLQLAKELGISDNAIRKHIKNTTSGH